MFKYATYFLYAFVASDLFGAQAADQCPKTPTLRGEVCLVELSPVLEHIANNQRSTDEVKRNETQKKLVRIESQEKDTVDKLQAIQKKMEIELGALEAKMAISGDLKSLELSLQETIKALQTSIASNRVKSNTEIPKQFQKIGSRYFYIEKEKGLDWFGAASKCHQLGAHLATIQNQVELDAINMKTSSNDYWLDITDLAKSGEFLSFATGGKPPFFKWAKNRPEAKMNQRCLHLFKGEMKEGMCSNTFFFICQLAQ
ncbi:accessory gland protein Acp29AB [Drosophila rhopaloa]|uniref:Accessory gland protein Acp29AB n=1 Tax=Drosophila rhopaloa TaxID=1041015 RepID=A0A6P4F5P2_DRORH|nr:accessory gland protein Acp29AB [Drosophila rhopaloa]